MRIIPAILLLVLVGCEHPVPEPTERQKLYNQPASKANCPFHCSRQLETAELVSIGRSSNDVFIAEYKCGYGCKIKVYKDHCGDWRIYEGEKNEDDWNAERIRLDD